MAGPAEEVREREVAASVGSLHQEVGVQDEECGHVVRRGGGVADVAHHGAHVTDLRRAGLGRGMGDGGVVAPSRPRPRQRPQDASWHRW